MAAVRDLPAECASIRKGQWQMSVGENLEGKTLGVVGLGRIGSSIAKYAQAFGMNAIAWSQNLTSETAEQRGARLRLEGRTISRGGYRHGSFDPDGRPKESSARPS